MSIKISTLMALYFYLDADLVNATIRDVEDHEIVRDFFASRFIRLDANNRIANMIGDIKSVKKGTLDWTCKKLQIRRLQKFFPSALAYEQDTAFGDFFIPPGALGLDSINVYDQRVPSDTWEIGQYEYLLLPVYGTSYKKEIYHVPSLVHADSRGNVYWVDDGYFGLDDINDRGRPLIFNINEHNQAVLVGYEDALRFSFR